MTQDMLISESVLTLSVLRVCQFNIALRLIIILAASMAVSTQNCASVREGTCMTHSGVECVMTNNGKTSITDRVNSDGKHCDSSFLLRIDEVFIKPGCQNYSYDNTVWNDCGNTKVYDVYTKSCVQILNNDWEPCPIFFDTYTYFTEVPLGKGPINWVDTEYDHRRTGVSSVTMCSKCILNFNECSQTECSPSMLIANIDTSTKRSAKVIDSRMKKPSGLPCVDKPRGSHLSCKFEDAICKLETYGITDSLGVSESLTRTNFVSCYELSDYSILSNDTCCNYCKTTASCQMVGLLCSDLKCENVSVNKGECFCAYSSVKVNKRYDYMDYEFAENTCKAMTADVEMNSVGKVRKKRQTGNQYDESHNKEVREAPEVRCSREGDVINCGFLPCDYRISVGDVSTIRRKSEMATLTVNSSQSSIELMIDLLLYCESGSLWTFDGVTHKDGDIILIRREIRETDVCETMGWFQKSTHWQCFLKDHNSFNIWMKRSLFMGSAFLLTYILMTLIKIIKYIASFFCWRRHNDSLEQIAKAVTGNLSSTSSDLLELSELKEKYNNYKLRGSWWKTLTCWSYRAERRMMDLMFRIGSESKLDVISMTDKIINLKNDLGLDTTKEEKALSLVRSDSETASTSSINLSAGGSRSSRSSRLKRLGLASLAIMSIFHPCSASQVCSGVLVSGVYEECYNSDDGKTIACDVSVSSSIDILSVGQSVCLSIMNGSDIVMSLDILYEDLSRVWSLSKQYVTGSYRPVSSMKKVCRDGGYCDGSCNGQEEQNHLYGKDSSLIGYDNEMYTESVCCNWLVTAFECADMRKCGGESISLNTFGMSRSTVMSLVTGQSAASVVVDLKVVGQDGLTSKTNSRIQLGTSEKMGDVEITLVAVNNMPEIILNDNGLVINDTHVSLSKVCRVNEPKLGILGEIQADSLSGWDSPRVTRQPYQTTYKADSEIIRLSCDSWAIKGDVKSPIYDKYSVNDYPGSVVLPGYYGGNLWSFDRTTKDLIESINGTRPINMNVLIKGKFTISKMTHKCSPEFKFVNLTGCHTCEYNGAELTLEVRSLNGYGCYVTVNHISDMLTCLGTIRIESGEEQKINFRCNGKSKAVDEVMTIRYEGKNYKIEIKGELFESNYTTSSESIMSELNSVWNEFVGFLKGLGIVAAVVTAVVGSLLLGGLLMVMCLGWNNTLVILSGFLITRIIMKAFCCGQKNKQIDELRENSGTNEEYIKLREKYEKAKKKASDLISKENIERKINNSIDIFKRK